MACFLKHTHDTSIRIPRNASVNGVTFYDIEVTIGNVSWTVRRRYREFVELNDKLITDQSISRDLLPPKKVIGNRSPTFLEQRQQSLEKYLQNILIFLQLTMCREFVEFLEFNKYDIIYLLQDMSDKFYQQGELLLIQSKSYTFTVLELYAISERLKMPCPSSGEVKKNYDFSHVLDFCSQLENVCVRSVKETNIGQNSILIEQDLAIGTSNIIPRNLKFDLNAFRNIKNTTIIGISTENVSDAVLLRDNTIELNVHHSGVSDLSSILLCDCVHRTTTDENVDKTKLWLKLESANFSSNSINNIDSSIRLLSKLKVLDLSRNQLKIISNLNCLPYLSSLNLSENMITECIDYHLEVGNLVTLNLAQNQIKSLNGFRKMYSLVALNVSCNMISTIDEVDHLSALPCLEELILTGNPLAASVDYRPRVLSRFGDRCEEVVLDNEKGDSTEIDMALVLAALRKSELNSQFQSKNNFINR